MIFDRLKRTTLYYKLTITVSLLFIIAYFISLFITQEISFHFVKQQYEDHIYTITRNMALISYQPILNQNEVEIYQTGRTFLREKDVRFVLILDKRNRILMQEAVPGFRIDSLSEEIVNRIVP